MAPMRPRSAVICFGFDKRTMRKQPWHMAHGLALGLASRGHTVTLFTDAAEQASDQAYAIRRLESLFEEGRCSDELKAVLADLAPAQIYLIIGASRLCRLESMPEGARWSLLLTSPRLRLREWARLGLRGLWRERDLLGLPLANALLPGRWLRHGFKRSRADAIIYTSVAARNRYAALGLPAGPVLRPQVDPPPIGLTVETSAPPSIVYLGPPLRLRGVDLAIEAFEKAVAQGLDAKLLLLLRPDVQRHRLTRCLMRVARSGVADRIYCETRMLDASDLRRRIAECSAVLLPFKVTVSDVPLVVIEAGLAGRPLIVLDTPGVSEVAAAFNGHIARTHSELPGLIRRAVMEGCADHGALCRHPPAVWTDWDRAVGDLLAATPDDRSGALRGLRMVGLSGVDGSGKTFILESIRRELDWQGLDHRHVWSRFRNYTSKPLLALARLTGHNRKEEIGGVRFGVHDFRHAPWLAWPFLALQFIDNVLDLILRYRLRADLVVGDRCILDTLVDLAADTGREDIVFGGYGRLLVGLLPRPNRLIILERPVEEIVRDRPDALADRMFFERRRLFLVLARRFGIPVIANRGRAEDVCAAILETHSPSLSISNRARSA